MPFVASAYGIARTELVAESFVATRSWPGPLTVAV
jgi:hypothetical protein